MWDKKLLRNLDWTFLAIIVVLLAVNLVVLSSASRNVVQNDPHYFLKKQLIWVMAGFFIMAFCAWFNYRFFEKIPYLVYGAMVLLLIGVLFMPEQKGAHRWYDLGFMDLQPSELAKIAMIIVFACFLAKKEGEMHRWSNFFLSALIMGLPAFLILIEPDLGTSLVFIAIFLSMLWVGGFPVRRMVILLLILIVLVCFIFGVLYVATDGWQHTPEELPIPLPLEPYQLTRLIIFMNPDMDPLNSGYHIIQSMVAIGSGGLLGKGFGNGSQVQGNFLPEHHTDFIFAAIGEEFGLLGCLVILGLYLLLLSRALKIAMRAKDTLGTLIVTGVVAMFIFQILVNVGMTIGIMPVTGLPLPLLSYGGSGMMVNTMALGLIFSVNLRNREVIFA